MLMRYSPIFALLLIFFLAGCSTAAEAPAVNDPPTAVATSLPVSVASERGWDTAVQNDRQGAVTVVVQPLNLDTPGDTLDFDVTLDTHSVDLSMDLALLASLVTHDGREINAIQWDAPRGGHHVNGVLSFPAMVDGSLFLSGTNQLTLVIKELSVQERRFNWSLVEP
jgi:hypothetical protein